MTITLLNVGTDDKGEKEKKGKYCVLQLDLGKGGKIRDFICYD